MIVQVLFKDVTFVFVKVIFEMHPKQNVLHYLSERNAKAYILLQRQTTCVGPSLCFRPPTRPFCV